MGGRKVGNAHPQTENHSATGVFEALREHYESHGQGHVFRFWDELDASGRKQLQAQAAAIDLPAVLRAHAASCRPEPPAADLGPAPVERLPQHGGDPAQHELAAERGRDMLAAGRVAACVVAGGQATRLGFDGPKGTFPLGPVTKRSLFELQAQKIRGLRRRHGRPLPWYVMTSPATDAATRAFFERNQYFGLPSEDVVFFVQAMVPSADFDGRLMLERPDRIFENPSGHGGTLPALLACGALDDMDSRGIDTIFYYQVDNPLVRIADPVYLGFHDAAGAEMSCKVVRKVDPAEKVGVVAQVGGGIRVIEYTELDDAQRCAHDADGALVYWAGSIAIHVFETAFVRRVAADADRLLPYHASDKAIPALDAGGRRVKPSRPNGRKLERFVFDALPAATRVCVVEADRATEFSPVKNAEGENSPKTARRTLSARARAWIDAAGIEGIPPEAAIEVDHSRIDGPEDARALGIRHISEAAGAILTAAGAAS
jgi:UDP-N-acetylglucosamine/UDP-N-acetylgalactosamine diphosphorylase